MAASSRAQVLDLYRAMLRESKHFSAYNYRTYAIRRIRDAFRENKNVKDPVEIQTLVNKAKRDLGMIRRQNISIWTSLFQLLNSHMADRTILEATYSVISTAASIPSWPPDVC
uniref:LYR motif containing 4 n=1 Tax=Rousettus aegyptiacus TaxID=9407 RepID=A0A7J8KC17_ROUAE|nr:LYR motif containing 4 [Rousettus aegyptiacus]